MLSTPPQMTAVFAVFFCLNISKLYTFSFPWEWLMNEHEIEKEVELLSPTAPYKDLSTYHFHSPKCKPQAI